MTAMLLSIVTLGGVGWLVFAWRARRDAAVARQSARRRKAREQVLREFNDVYGYLGDVVHGQEARRLIQAEPDPAQLRHQLTERVAAIDGPLLGHHLAGSARLPIRMPMQLRLRHTLVVGKTGVGKSTMLVNAIVDDMERGLGLAAISPEPEFFEEDLLRLVPPHRHADVIYINPRDTTAPVVLNPLQCDPGEDLDLKVAETMAVMERLCGEEGSTAAPRTHGLLRQSLYLLMRIRGSTLLDVEPLLDRTDDGFRRWALDQIDDELAQRFWTRTYLAYARDSHIPLVNRLSRFLRPRFTRSLMCTSGSGLNIRRCMDEGKIILLNASDGILGQENAEIVGQLFTSKLQLGSMSRADTPKDQRRPFMVYIDEFPFFCNVGATSYERMFSRSRKYGLGLTLAAQHLGQIPEPLLRDILGTIGSITAFQVGSTDARRLAREFVGERNGETLAIEPETFLRLPVGHAVCRIGRHVFRLQTPSPRAGGCDATRKTVEALSQQVHGARPRTVASGDRPTPTAAFDPAEVF